MSSVSYEKQANCSHWPYVVRVCGTWSRGRCEERSDIEELVNWRAMS